MFDRVLNQMRNRIRTRQYVMTLHAEEEMEDDELTILDVESVILTGAIFQRQKDATTGEWKYIIRGQSLGGERAEAVGKLGPTGQLVFITVYRDVRL